MKISTNQFKNGTKLIIDNAPCSIVEHEFHKPGKGQAVMRIKYKNLITGNTNDKTFKSGESVEAADISHKKWSFYIMIMSLGILWTPTHMSKLRLNRLKWMMRKNG